MIQNTNPFVLCYNYLLRASGNFQGIRKQQIAANLQATNKQSLHAILVP